MGITQQQHIMLARAALEAAQANLAVIDRPTAEPIPDEGWCSGHDVRVLEKGSAR